MTVNYWLPGSVIGLKILFRLLIDQETERVDLARAIIAFPIDIAFLSFSFAAAVLQTSSLFETSANSIISFVLTCVIFAALVIFFSKRSDKAFRDDRNRLALAFGAAAYFTSFVVLILSLNVTGFVS